MSPMIVYIPSKEVMFKMMRACLGCNHKEELWINYKDSQVTHDIHDDNHSDHVHLEIEKHSHEHSFSVQTEEGVDLEA